MRYLLSLLLLVTVCLIGRPAGGSSTCVPDGWEDRGQQWARWLFSAVRMNGASGTMCYYQPQGNWMYVISAGHLFGNLRSRMMGNTARIEVFYINFQKLSRPRRYDGEILASTYQHDSAERKAYDVSLVRFHPDWPNPQYSPIAPKGYQLERGKYYHSVGCDGSQEPAHYLSRYEGEEDIGNGMTQVITRTDQPRPGRSGGGVFTDDGYLVYICSRRHGTGAQGGSWTSLNQIYYFLEASGYAFIANEIPARRRAIVDLDYPSRTVTRSAIIVPLGARSR